MRASLPVVPSMRVRVLAGTGGLVPSSVMSKPAMPIDTARLREIPRVTAWQSGFMVTPPRAMGVTKPRQRPPERTSCEKSEFP